VLGSTLRCAICKRQIRRGIEEQKRVEYRLQPDGSEKIFGHQMPDGPLAKATGSLIKVIHSVHYWAETKAARRGGAHAGGAISAWEDDSIGVDHDNEDI
jgi:hypothetical protein